MLTIPNLVGILGTPISKNVDEVKVLRLGILAVATAAFLTVLIAPLKAPAAPNVTSRPIPESRLRLFHTHTNERLDIVFRRGDAYVPEALDALNNFLRDHRTGDVHQYDPRVFDLLSDLIASAGRPGAELQIICGYRTPWSNNYLRTHSTGVAQNSLHMQAEAIDIRLPGTPIQKFRDLALKLGRGGVGYYPASNFIHVDVGRVRRW